MRLLLAKTFNIVSFEKKRIKKKVCVQFVAITREERKRKERERERDPCFFRVLRRLVLFFVVKKRDKTTSERINIII